MVDIHPNVIYMFASMIFSRFSLTSYNISEASTVHHRSPPLSSSTYVLIKHHLQLYQGNQAKCPTETILTDNFIKPTRVFPNFQPTIPNKSHAPYPVNPRLPPQVFPPSKMHPNAKEAYRSYRPVSSENNMLKWKGG